MFAVVVTKLQPFKQYDVLGLVRPVKQLVAEYLRIGVPMGVAIFMETSIFGVVALFIAKFGTEVIAAHQAALNFSSLIYMFPMSFSLALTIVVGVEYGAKNYQGARDYTALGLEMSLFIAMLYMVLELVAREYIALIYTTNPHVIELVKVFIIYAIMWQGGDAIARRFRVFCVAIRMLTLHFGAACWLIGQFACRWACFWITSSIMVPLLIGRALISA